MKKLLNDPDLYDRIVKIGEKQVDGWYSQSDGFVSFEMIDKLRTIETFLQENGFKVTLAEAEYLWTSYCSEEHFASWIDFDQIYFEDFLQFVKTTFQ
jgi:hypothetical protein